MRPKRRSRRHSKGSNPPYREVDREGDGRREKQVILMSVSLVLLTLGGLSLLMANQTASVVRRFSNRAIQSASDLRGAARGRAVVLRGQIDQQTLASYWGLALYYCEQFDAPPQTNRFGGRSLSPRWVRCESFRPPFILVTNGERVPIINGHYAIEQPSAVRELGRFRCAGFRPGDEVLVIGNTAKGGISAGKVFGGTRAEFWKTLEEQRALIVVERRMGLLLMGLGLLLLALWAAPRIRKAASWSSSAVGDRTHL